MENLIHFSTKTKNIWYHFMKIGPIDEIGHVRTANYHQTRMMKMWTFGVVLAGTRTIAVNERQIEAEQGEYFILPPDTLHGPVRLDKHDVYYVHFSAETIELSGQPEKFIRGICLPQVGKLPVLLKTTELLAFLYRNYCFGYVDKYWLECDFASLLHLISVGIQKDEWSRQKKKGTAEQIMEFLLQHIEEKGFKDTMESQFGLSYQRLNIIFKNRFGCTIKGRMTEIRMEKAVHYLLRGMTLKKTAAMTGFDDYYYFIKVFKQRIGVTPGQYQKMNCEK